MAVTTEIAPNIYRTSVFAQWGNLQCGQVGCSTLILHLDGTLVCAGRRGGRALHEPF